MNEEFAFGYYNKLRFQARKITVDAFNKRIKKPIHRKKWKAITFASFDREALNYARQYWPQHYTSNYTGLPISWERLYYSYIAKPDNFNLAIWRDDGSNPKSLQGLALGKPSKGKRFLTISWMERSFADDFFIGGITLPILTVAEAYAKLLGCECVKIKDPEDKNEFANYGYLPYDGHNNILVKAIKKANE
ncbi:hypothetical protein [Bartonella apis]|uniref:hypothetical protein n=1 Tax=Bartonella apis TaxID=1686310 RepID=UPI00242BC187|nr:hypothetical protein [Bartonella apis]